MEKWNELSESMLDASNDELITSVIGEEENELNWSAIKKPLNGSSSMLNDQILQQSVQLYPPTRDYLLKGNHPSPPRSRSSSRNSSPIERRREPLSKSAESMWSPEIARSIHDVLINDRASLSSSLLANSKYTGSNGNTSNKKKRGTVLGSFLHMVQPTDPRAFTHFTGQDITTMLKQLALLEIQIREKNQQDREVLEEKILRSWHAVHQLERSLQHNELEDEVAQELVYTHNQLNHLLGLMDRMNTSLVPVFEKLHSYQNMKKEAIKKEKFMKSIKSFTLRTKTNQEYSDKILALEAAVRRLDRINEKRERMMKTPVRGEVNRINGTGLTPVASPMASGGWKGGFGRKSAEKLDSEKTPVQVVNTPSTPLRFSNDVYSNSFYDAIGARKLSEAELTSGSEVSREVDYSYFEGEKRAEESELLQESAESLPLPEPEPSQPQPVPEPEPEPELVVVEDQQKEVEAEVTEPEDLPGVDLQEDVTEDLTASYPQPPSYEVPTAPPNNTWVPPPVYEPPTSALVQENVEMEQTQEVQVETVEEKEDLPPPYSESEDEALPGIALDDEDAPMPNINTAIEEQVSPPAYLDDRPSPARRALLLEDDSEAIGGDLPPPPPPVTPPSSIQPRGSIFDSPSKMALNTIFEEETSPANDGLSPNPKSPAAFLPAFPSSFEQTDVPGYDHVEISVLDVPDDVSVLSGSEVGSVTSSVVRKKRRPSIKGLVKRTKSLLGIAPKKSESDLHGAAEAGSQSASRRPSASADSVASQSRRPSASGDSTSQLAFEGIAVEATDGGSVNGSSQQTSSPARPRRSSKNHVKHVK
eukprot:gene8144-8985_t